MWLPFNLLNENVKQETGFSRPLGWRASKSTAWKREERLATTVFT
jgi:hypothetical protein